MYAILCSMQYVFWQLSNKTLHLQHQVYKSTYAYMHFHTCKQTHVVKMHMQTYAIADMHASKVYYDGRWQLDLVNRYKPSWYRWCQVSFSHKKIISDKDRTFSLVMTNGVCVSTSPQPSFMTVRKQIATLAILKGHWFQSHKPLWIVQVAPGVMS